VPRPSTQPCDHACPRYLENVRCERVGVGEAHPTRRFVLLSRRRPSQQRFRIPERLCGVPSIERACFNEARQERRCRALHQARPIPEHMDPLGEGLLRVGTGRVIVLAQPGRAGRELHQVAARSGRLLPEDGHEAARARTLTDRPNDFWKATEEIFSVLTTLP